MFVFDQQFFQHLFCISFCTNVIPVGEGAAGREWVRKVRRVFGFLR